MLLFWCVVLDLYFCEFEILVVVFVLYEFVDVVCDVVEVVIGEIFCDVGFGVL